MGTFSIGQLYKQFTATTPGWKTRKNFWTSLFTWTAENVHRINFPTVYIQ